MSISGILVSAHPDRMAQCATALRTVPGIDVHYLDAATGRIIVTQEAPSVGAEVAGLRRIQSLPDVLAVSLVYHYCGDDGGAGADAAAVCDASRSGALPLALDD
jgi:nitrate reductase NapD